MADRVTMDKHEHRRLRANAQYLGKSREKFLRAVRGDSTVQDKRTLYTALETYAPKRFVTYLRRAERVHDYSRVVNVDGEDVSLWLLDNPRGGPYAWLIREERPLLERLWAEIEMGAVTPMVDSFLRWVRPMRHQIPYVWDAAGNHIRVKESLKELKHQIDIELVREQGPSFFRTTERTALFRAELEIAARRSRCVQNCKVIKEELMAAAWHPRRVEHILDTYGWEAYENLLGEE